MKTTSSRARVECCTDFFLSLNLLPHASIRFFVFGFATISGCKADCRVGLLDHLYAFQLFVAHLPAIVFSTQRRFNGVSIDCSRRRRNNVSLATRDICVLYMEGVLPMRF